jgi:hypothetical protein
MFTFILPLILEYAGDAVVLETLKHFIPKWMYHQFTTVGKRTLIYGQVQSGKTAHIITLLKTISHTCVIVVQNSSFVREQYYQRFTQASLPCQILTARTNVIDKPIVILMNNVFQREKFESMNTVKYSIICDEADITQKSPLCAGAINTYCVTATPYIKSFQHRFHSVVHLSPPTTYHGIQKLNIVPIPPTKKELLADFLKCPAGMMLINYYVRVADMIQEAVHLSRLVPHIPVIVLTSKKYVYYNHRIQEIFVPNLSKIIDRFEGSPCIFIANRMACRGVSFMNTGYTRHLTHQVSNVTNFCSFVQKCRICGIYNTPASLTLYIPSGKSVTNIIAKLSKFDCENFLNASPPDDRLHRIRSPLRGNPNVGSN